MDDAEADADGGYEGELHGCWVSELECKKRVWNSEVLRSWGDVEERWRNIGRRETLI